MLTSIHITSPGTAYEITTQALQMKEGGEVVVGGGPRGGRRAKGEREVLWAQAVSQ